MNKMMITRKGREEKKEIETEILSILNDENGKVLAFNFYSYITVSKRKEEIEKYERIYNPLNQIRFISRYTIQCCLWKMLFIFTSIGFLGAFFSIFNENKNEKEKWKNSNIFTFIILFSMGF